MSSLRAPFLVFVMLGVLLTGMAPALAADPAGPPALAELRQENTALRRQVQRLERQVAAQRDELSRPGASEVFGGLGYIVGIFGIAAWWSARRQANREN